MTKLLLVLVVGAVAVGAYNYRNGRDLLSVPTISAGAITDTVRQTVNDTVRATVRDTVRETRAEAKERAAEAKERAAETAHAALSRTENAVSTMTLTTKIKAKMALDDVVRASDINVDTEGTIVTLTGDVRSKDEQRRAVRIATETQGVTKVVNRLTVR